MTTGDFVSSIRVGTIDVGWCFLLCFDVLPVFPCSLECIDMDSLLLLLRDFDRTVLTLLCGPNAIFLFGDVSSDVDTGAEVEAYPCVND